MRIKEKLRSYHHQEISKFEVITGKCDDLRVLTSEELLKKEVEQVIEIENSRDSRTSK